MSLTSLRTARLRGGDWRAFCTDDLAALFAPDVVEFLPGGFQGLEVEGEQRSFLAKLSQQASVVALCDVSGQGVGLLILSHVDQNTPERHLGYLFAQHVWGQGLATELVAALQAQFRDANVTLCGGVMLGNTASARLLERAGFHGAETDGEVIYRWTGTGQ
ncbi:GNAT family N-acetyltransferase [Rhodobacterales bacterium 56_14_T64]|nr:GNAT family N-acetyltransferase [Rhodobacterales bacterium 56_14_T64]